MPLKHLRAAALSAGLVGAIALPLPAAASADPCTSSTATTTSFADSGVDGGALAPEVTGGAMSVDGGCVLTASYTVPDQPFGMLSSDFLSWFIDTDGNAATGARTAFAGADYAIGRTDTTAALLKYNAVTDGFDVVKSLTTFGDFGASVNLNDVNAISGARMTVAGAGSWTSPSTGSKFYDWVPDVGQPATAFTASFTGALAQPVAPVVTTPAPVVTSAPSSTSTQVSKAAPTCVVPVLKGLSVTKAKMAILDA